MDGVVIERTRPRLVSRCGLREDRNCLYRRATLLDESAPHASNASCFQVATKYQYDNSPRPRAPIHAGPRVASGATAGVVSSPTSRACARRMPACTRCDGILSKGKGTAPHLHKRAARTPTATRPRRARPTRQGEPGVAGAHSPTPRRKREAHSTLRSSSRTFSHRHDKSPRRRLRRRRQLEDYTPCAPSSCDLGDV